MMLKSIIEGKFNFDTDEVNKNDVVLLRSSSSRLISYYSK